jgi:hypothetical protein
MFSLARDTVVAHGIPRTMLLRPPVQFGVGGAFQSAGVPQIGAISGPEYLVTVSENGDLDKLDEALAARQIAWLADLAGRIDRLPAAALRGGDPTLGHGGGAGTAGVALTCGSGSLSVSGGSRSGSGHLHTGPRLLLRYMGWRGWVRGLLVILSTDGGSLGRVVVELWRGRRRVASTRVDGVSPAPRRVVLRPRAGARFAPGDYVLVVRPGAAATGSALARRKVRIGSAPRRRPGSPGPKA